MFEINALMIQVGYILAQLKSMNSAQGAFCEHLARSTKIFFLKTI